MYFGGLVGRGAGGFGAFRLFCEPGLHGGVAGNDHGCPAEEEDGAPGNEVGDDEEGGGEEKEVEEDGRGEDFVGEIG